MTPRGAALAGTLQGTAWWPSGQHRAKEDSLASPFGQLPKQGPLPPDGAIAGG